MGRFLKANAMQIAGLAQATMGTVLTFTHLTTAQTAALGAYPTALGTFLFGMVLKRDGGKAAAAP